MVENIQSIFVMLVEMLFIKKHWYEATNKCYYFFNGKMSTEILILIRIQSSIIQSTFIDYVIQAK